MLGGYQILDLTNINLELGADAVDITDSGVLKQLLNLREYIEKGYDFSRPLNNQLKPFQVRYRDKKADEEITATLWASLLVIESGFIISASIPNYANLEIFVTFSEETDDDGNNYWVINSAQVTYSLIASSGTKLYKHELYISLNDDIIWHITLISAKQTQYTAQTLDNSAVVSYLNANESEMGEGDCCLFNLFYNNNNINIHVVELSSGATQINYHEIAVSDITEFIDTVTEL